MANDHMESVLGLDWHSDLVSYRRFALDSSWNRSYFSCALNDYHSLWLRHVTLSPPRRVGEGG